MFAFDAPPVNHPVDLRNGAGSAFERAARYSLTDLNCNRGAAGEAAPLDGVRGGEQKIYAAGLNWYLNPIIRSMFDYQHVTIDRLLPSAATFVTPAGAEVGQHYHVFKVRSQLAF